MFVLSRSFGFVFVYLIVLFSFRFVSCFVLCLFSFCFLCLVFVGCYLLSLAYLRVLFAVGLLCVTSIVRCFSFVCVSFACLVLLFACFHLFCFVVCFVSGCMLCIQNGHECNNDYET